MNGFIKYLIFFVLVYMLVFVLYYFVIVNPQLKEIRGKRKGVKDKKKKKNPPEVELLRVYYKIDIDKVGYIKTLRILNFVNPLLITLMVMVVFPISKIWLKLLILVAIIMPVIWFSYYFLAKYFRYLERKNEDV